MYATLTLGIPLVRIRGTNLIGAVTGYRGAYIAVLIGGNTFRWKFVERDEELISMLIDLEANFWNCVQTNTPPPMDGSDASARFLAERFPDSVPKSQIILPDSATELLQQYDAACEQLTAATEKKQYAENVLKNKCPARTVTFSRDNRILEGHRMEVRYIASLTI